MSRRDEVLVKHKTAICAAARRSKARSIALVGSTARGDDNDQSDYDFLVDFEDDADLFDIAGLQVDPEDLLGHAVDVVDSSSVRESHIAMFEDAMPLRTLFRGLLSRPPHASAVPAEEELTAIAGAFERREFSSEELATIKKTRRGSPRLGETRAEVHTFPAPPSLMALIRERAASEGTTASLVIRDAVGAYLSPR